MAGAITDISNVTISLNGVAVSRLGFGTPLFLSKHRFSEERVSSFNSLRAVAEVFPVESNAYKAAQAFFSNSPVAKAFKVGRINSSMVLTPAAVVTGKVYSFTIKAGVASANISVTASGVDTVTTIGAAVAAAIEASPVAALVAATAAVGVVTIAPTTGDFAVTALKEFTFSHTSAVTAPVALQACLDADADNYFITSEDHSEAWTLALAADVEARLKLFVFSVAGATNYGTYTKGTAVSGDILGKIADFGYMRTAGMYHQDADTAFPEMQWVGHNAPFDAGSVIWANNVVTIPAAKNVDGNILTGTQQNNISARNATFIRLEGGLNATRGGLVAGGEKIDNIRGRDDLQETMKANLTSLLLNQKGGKLPFNDTGINTVRSVVQDSLDIFVRRNFINDNYRIRFPKASEIDVAKKAIGLFDQGTFQAELTGAIELIDITGSLSVAF